jgi:hypothetical protein
MAGATGAGLMVIEKVWVAAGLTPFEAVIVPVHVPRLVGMPEMTPAELKLNPGGRVPDVTLKVGAGVPLAV